MDHRMLKMQDFQPNCFILRTKQILNTTLCVSKANLTILLEKLIEFKKIFLIKEGDQLPEHCYFG
jgi:hypothetical protein